MGRSNKNKRKQNAQKGGRAKKKRHVVRPSFWVLECNESKPALEGESFDIELLITRAAVTDDYRQVPMKADESNDGGDKEDDLKVYPAKNNSCKERVEETDAKEVKFVVLDASENYAFARNAERKEEVAKDSTEGITDKIDDDASDNVPEDKEQKSPKILIRKSKSAKRPKKHFFDSVENFKPLPNGDCGDGIVNPYPKDEVPDKYWSQRRRYFDLFDCGIQLDKQSWFSVTPQAIADHIARHLVGSQEGVVVCDPFCGCGGNSIAFARHPQVKQVLCVDSDVEKLKKAHWNASIYGVQEKLLLVHGDAFSVLCRYKDGKLLEKDSPLPDYIHLLFLSPPWGGMDYGKCGNDGFTLSRIKISGQNGAEYDGDDLLRCAALSLGRKATAYFLPKNTNGYSFAKSAIQAGYTTPIVMEQNDLNGKLKTITCYLGLGCE